MLNLLQKNRKKRNEQGFTLVELMVVIAIIGILAAVVAPNVFKQIDKSKVSSAGADYNAIKTAVLAYRADTSKHPEELDNLVNKPDTEVPGWAGAYLDRVPVKNSWGGAIALETATADDASIGVKKDDLLIKLEGLSKNVIDALKAEIDRVDPSDTTRKTGIVRYKDDAETTEIVYLFVAPAP